MRAFMDPQNLRMSGVSHQLTDLAWAHLIDEAERCRRILLRFDNMRFGRKMYYRIWALTDLASYLVQNGYIMQWDAGFRRLHRIEEQMALEYRRFWKQTVID